MEFTLVTPLFLLNSKLMWYSRSRERQVACQTLALFNFFASDERKDRYELLLTVARLGF